MCAYSNFYLNQRLSNLQSQVNQLSNPITGFVPIEGNSIIGGIKIFNQNPPQTPFQPVNADDIVNKTYVDSLVPTPIDAVLLNGNQTLGTGIKTFLNLPQSASVPINNNDFVNKFYVDSQTSGGLTLNDVLSNTLPFTATQTFDNGIITNQPSTFNKVINANNGINTNLISGLTGAGDLNIYAPSGSIGIYAPLQVSGASTFLSTLTTQNITGTDINLNANSLTTNATILMKQNAYIPSTAGFNFGDNFSGTTTNGNTFLSQGAGRFQIYNTSNSNSTGQATDILIYSKAGIGDPLLSTITMQTGTMADIIINKNLITLSTLSNFVLNPTTTASATANNELTNVQSVNNLIANNMPNFALRDSSNTFSNTNNFVLNPTTPAIATANNELTNVQSVNNLIANNMPNFALRDSSNTFSNTNNFTLNPTTSAMATLSTQIPNLQQIQSLISGGGVGNATLSANPQTFTGQNIFSLYTPQTPVQPTTNNDLVNLLYLNTQLLNLRSIIPLKASQNIGPVSGDFTYQLIINSWTTYLIDDFITLRYSLSNNFTYAGPITPSSYTANSWGFVDIYPYRLGNGAGNSFINVLNYNVLTNSFNGSTAYNLTSPSLPRGRWFWSYNNTNSTSYTNPALGFNGFYLYISALVGQVLTIGLYLPTPISGGTYTNSFNIELMSSLDNSKISSDSFKTNF